MADPKFVRLADHLTRGMRADVGGSGWSIAGLDVVEMPDKEDDPDGYRYVKAELSAGRLEGAGQAEYDEAHPDLAEDTGLPVEVLAGALQGVRSVQQETHIQREAGKAHRALVASREGLDEDEVEAEEARRAAAIKASKQYEGGVGGKAAKKARRAAAEKNQAEEERLAADEADGGAPGDEDSPSGERLQ